MSILISNEIADAVKKELVAANQSVQIISAYCKENAIRKIDSYIATNVLGKKIMIRFRMEDLLKGSTDFSVAKYCLENGWSVYIRFDLHAKTYVIDNMRGIVTSANATNSGLGFGSKSNMEVATLVNMEQDDLIKITSMFSDAIKVNEELLLKMEEQLGKIKNTDKNADYNEWDRSITQLFHPNIVTLFSHELPSDNTQIDGYVDFLDQDFHGDLVALKNAFRWSKPYLWLLSNLQKNDNCMYFGALTAQLHRDMVSDPKPYRKDVKVYLSKLLALVEKLKMEEVLIDTPSHSQRVRLVK